MQNYFVNDIMPEVKISIRDPKEFNISILKKEHINGAADIFSRTFCYDEPLTKYLGISHDAFKLFATEVVIQAAKHQLSVVACNSSGKVVACTIAEDIVQPFDIEENEVIQPIFNFLEALSKPFSDMCFKKKSLIHLFANAVSTEVRGLGLSTLLNSACVSLALQNGFSYFSGEFTNEISEKFMKKFTDHMKHELSFKDFVLDGGKPFEFLEGRACSYISSAAPYIFLKDIKNSLLKPCKLIDHAFKYNKSQVAINSIADY